MEFSSRYDTRMIRLVDPRPRTREAHVGSVLATHHVIKLVGNKLRLGFGDVRSSTVRVQHSMFLYSRQLSTSSLRIVAVFILVDASFHQHGRSCCLVELGFPAPQLLCRLQPPRDVTVFEFRGDMHWKYQYGEYLVGGFSECRS
jgi:hypothetical protein